ncbi:MAG TPA: RNA methyltransferase [Gemmataceae bacterium]|nr:RNA methyltransferase [Gemmataceae bacterium]
MSLSNCRVVLVRTKVAANIGSAARALRNMGMSDLVLVAPDADPADPRAELLATPHAADVLHSARVVATFEEAVADCLLVAATSANVGGQFRRQSAGTPEVVAEHLLRVLPIGPAALVFGPEPSGLSNDEVARCHYLIHVPTDPAYPALNLAQAVVVCTYALRSAFLRQTAAREAPDPPAPYAEQERMFDHLRAALTELHFLYGEKADALMHGLRHLIARAGPTAMEVGLLHGLARQIEWQVRNHGAGNDPD